MRASYKGHVDAVKALIDAGAKMDIQDRVSMRYGVELHRINESVVLSDYITLHYLFVIAAPSF